MSRDALVVGISQYQCLPSLTAPAHDAEAIAQRLQTDGDFRTTRMPEIVQADQPKVGFKTQVTLAELEAALVRLFKPKGSTVPQTALFYFSGHGLQKDAGIQEGYLATSDANPDIGCYGLSLFWLRRLLQESPVRQRIVILDCCNSGELLNFLEADPGARAGTDRLFMAASREYESAYESLASQYSVFTQAVLDGLDPKRIINGTVTNYALTDWVSNALKTETQQPLFENSGSEIILTRGQGASTVIKTELSPEICPYRGLEFFDEAHAEYFFGREELTDQLIEKLRTRNFVAVVGASGSGKSSLVRAGLIHKLRQGQKFSGSDRWRIQLITPTEQPLKSLATAFVNPKDSAIDRADQLRRAEALLRDGGSGLYHLVRASLMTAKQGRNSRLLLIIDQFEEVFTLCQGPQAERDRHSFFNCLMTALRESSDCLSVVVVLRADFFGKYSLYQGLSEQIEQNLVTVTPLTYEQIKASVIKPAQKVGLICEPNLVYNILLDVVGAPGELPLLQYTLLELWQQRQTDPNGGADRLTLDAYTELGGVRGTLQKRANEVFYSLMPAEQQVARRIFIALTQIGDGTEDTRRRILKSELIGSKFSAELVDRVLEKLVAAKLIVTNRVLPSVRYQEHVDQGLANVSTALKLAQISRGKSPRPQAFNPLSAILPSHTPFSKDYSFNISGLTQLPASDLLSLHCSQSVEVHQETVDVAHEALIRNWSLLRIWLDENRETLRRQRRIEHAAKEWYGSEQPRSTEYLLRGDRLIDAEDYLSTYPDDLSASAQRFVTASREENRRTQKELRLVQLVVPCTLLIALVVTFNQYWTAVKSQAEKDYQLQIATSRQQAAIAQSILQEPDGDPTTALLISRLAAENGGYTYEAEASLRAALQKLQLQADLRGHQGAVHQVVFSPNQRQLATAGEDGTVRLWSIKTQSVERVLSWKNGIETTKDGGSFSAHAPAMLSIAFSPDGKQIAAIAKGANTIKVWSVDSGAVKLTLAGFNQAATKLAFSSTGNWISAASADNSIRVWNAHTGKQKLTHSYAAPINSLEFSPDDRLLTASGSTAQLWRVSTGQVEKELKHPGLVNRATFAPNGQLIATASEDGRARLWLANTGQLRSILNTVEATAAANQSSRSPQGLQQVLFSPNGQFLATAHSNQAVQLWQVKSGQLQAQLTAGSSEEESIPSAPIAFSPDSRIAVAERDLSDDRSNKVQLWGSTGRSIGSLRGDAATVESIQFSLDGSLVATASTDGSVRLWSSEMGSEFPTIRLASKPLRSAMFRQPSFDATFNFNSATNAVAFNQLRDAVNANGLVTVAADGTIYSWNLLKQGSFPQDSVQNVVSHSTADSDSAFSQPAKSLASLKAVGDYIWSLGNRHQGQLPTTPASDMNSPLSQLSSASLLSNQSVMPPDQIEAVQTERSRPTTEAAPAPANWIQKIPSKATLTSVALSADTQLIATASVEGNLEIWQTQLEKTNRLQTLEALQPVNLQRDNSTSKSRTTHSNTIRHFAFSPNNRILLGVGDDRVIRLWDVSSGKLVRSLQGHEAAIEQAQFSADGQLIVSASRDRTARVWQVTSGQLLNVLQHQHPINSARFSPDGQLVVTTSQNGTARILDRKTGEPRVILAGHRGAVLDAEFSPDGQRLVTASADGTARVWDAQTGLEQVLLRPGSVEGASEPVKQAFFSPDNRYVATLGASGQLNVWAATWNGLLELAHDRSVRQLRPEECLRYLRLPPNACPTLAR